ncbi:MAG: hypothetical protein ACOVLE_14375, partial [Pirellula staleyi]
MLPENKRLNGRCQKNASYEQNSHKLFQKFSQCSMIIDMEQVKSRKINIDPAFNPLWEVQKVVKER